MISCGQGPTSAIRRHGLVYQLNLLFQESPVSLIAIPVFTLSETPHIPLKMLLVASFSPEDHHCYGLMISR